MLFFVVLFSSIISCKAITRFRELAGLRGAAWGEGVKQELVKVKSTPLVCRNSIKTKNPGGRTWGRFLVLMGGNWFKRVLSYFFRAIYLFENKGFKSFVQQEYFNPEIEGGIGSKITSPLNLDLIKMVIFSYIFIL